MPRFGKKRAFSKSRFSRPIKKRFIKKRKLGKYATRKRFNARKPSSQSRMGFALQMAKQLPDQVYLFNNQDYVTVQGTTNSKATQFMWAQQQDVTNVTTSIAGPTVNLMPHDLNLVQQILYQQLSAPGGSVPTATPVGVLPTAQVLVKSWSTSMVIRNLETGPITFIHYRCRARRDLGGTDSSLSGPQGILINGFSDTSVQTTPPTGVTNPLLATTLGATPFMNPRFTANVHVVKTKTYELRPGGVIKLRYTLNRPRLWKNEDFNFGTAPDGDGSLPPVRSVLRGQMFSVFQMSGTYATAAAANTGYEKGIGNAAVGIIQQHKVHYATITPQVMQTSGINAVPGFSLGVAGYPLPIVATQPYSTINETTGARVLGTSFTTTQGDGIQTA